ncbi:MAG: M3 family oligoendopeptidase [Oscillospiraceae bacterium]|nr:M3 family oligoendopeptidase [Oscillospiraceae bacterium]
MKFTEMPYSRPDVQALMAKYRELKDKFVAAKSAQEQIDIYKEVETAEFDFYTSECMVYIRNSVNVNDEFYKAERAFFDEWMPKVSQVSQEFSMAMLSSPFLPELKKELGAHFFSGMEAGLKTFNSSVIDLMAEESALCNEYQALTGSAKLELDGKVLNLSQLTPYTVSPDREMRKAATEVLGKFFDDHREEFDTIYDKLVKNRHQQALKLGFKNYAELIYLKKNRPYTMEDVAKFRKQVLEVMVPKNVEYKKQQAEAIGVGDDFKFYDDGFAFPDGNPKPKCTIDESIKLAQQMYSELSEETKELWDLMVEHDMFDIAAKPGKRPGGYCATLFNTGMPFIFANGNGTAGDIKTLTHEAGHALAALTGHKNIKYKALSHACAVGAETHSMGMEFLTSPWHHLFFGEDTAKYQESHTKDALFFIPYGVIVDYFQELVYTNPDWTPDERNAAWLELEHQFRPYLDFGDLPAFSRGAGWQKQLHIYTIPFYYIEYSLAQTLALQIYSLFLQDRDAAWKKYMKFLKVGGTMNIVDTIEYAGLTSPFSENSLGKVCEPVWNVVDNLKK